jgi:hypothetical protein
MKTRVIEEGQRPAGVEPSHVAPATRAWGCAPSPPARLWRYRARGRARFASQAAASPRGRLAVATTQAISRPTATDFQRPRTRSHRKASTSAPTHRAGSVISPACASRPVRAGLSSLASDRPAMSPDTSPRSSTRRSPTSTPIRSGSPRGGRGRGQTHAAGAAELLAGPRHRCWDPDGHVAAREGQLVGGRDERRRLSRRLARLRVGAHIPALRWVAFGFLAGGAVVLLVGASLLYLGVRRRDPELEYAGAR